jgi:hypothetical protein
MADANGPKTYKLYQYHPSLAAAIILCLLFCLTTIYHAWQMFKRRTWFLIPFVVGGFCKQEVYWAWIYDTADTHLRVEFVGYACRGSSARQPVGQYRLMPFVIQNSFILIAPALFAATIYMILGRVIRLTDGDQHAIVKNGTVTRFFLIGDIFCFALQAAGKHAVCANCAKEANYIHRWQSDGDSNDQDRFIES